MKTPRASVVLATAATLAVCACGPGGGAQYPPREVGCSVRRFPEQPTIPVDDLGSLHVECAQNGEKCERQLLDAVCVRGGDVAWGLADNALSTTVLVAHAAHSKRVAEGPRVRGCHVGVSENAPPPSSVNIGPVLAYCSADDPQPTCLRELEDQVCLMGGDFLWQVEGPSVDGDKQRMRGRAAKTP